MNLRRIRIRLTLLYTALSAVAIVALAVVAARAGSERIREGADREAEQTVAGLTIADSQSSDLDAENSWFVHLGNGQDVYNQVLGDSWVEPPLYTVAADAIEYEATYSEFEQDGSPWLAFGQRLNDTDAFVTAVSLDYYLDRASSLRLRVWLAAAAAIVAVGVVGWFVAGRSLRPAHAANERQRDFIADAAHELRTPLSVIRASSSHALTRDRQAGEYREALIEIEAAAQRAGLAVGELLELARIDAGRFAPRLTPERLDLLVEEVVAGTRVDGCTLTASAAEPIVVEVDYALLRQAIDNVVRNAADRATRVDVTVAVERRLAVVEVADDGPGFPDALLPHVFERFRRGDGRGSSGLGLAIARSIVEAHGGGVDARNREPGEGGGAVVRLTLPRPKLSRR